MQKNIIITYFSFFIVTVLTASLVFILTNHQDLIIMFFVFLSSNSFIAIPHEPFVLYYGKLYAPWLLLIISVAPTLLGSYLDYVFLKPVLGHRKFRKLIQSDIYKKAERYFNMIPSAALFIAAVSPIPFYPFRILSVTSGFSMHRYAFITLAGRLPRYYILAAGGMLLNIPNWILILLLVIMLSIPVIKSWYGKRTSRKVPSINISDSVTENP